MRIRGTDSRMGWGGGALPRRLRRCFYGAFHIIDVLADDSDAVCFYQAASWSVTSQLHDESSSLIPSPHSLSGAWLGMLIHFFILQRRTSNESNSSLARFKSKSILNTWKPISSDDAVPSSSTSVWGRHKDKEAEIERRPQLSPKKASFTVLGQNEREAGYTYGYSEHDDVDYQDDRADGDLGYSSQPAVHFAGHTQMGGRGSIDPYGAFDGDGMPRQANTPKRNVPPPLVAEMAGRDAGGIGNKSGVVSRTMLLASSSTYVDPCEWSGSWLW